MRKIRTATSKRPNGEFLAEADKGRNSRALVRLAGLPPLCFESIEFGSSTHAEHGQGA